MTVDVLVEIDKLVTMIESPVLACKLKKIYRKKTPFRC